MDAVRSFYVITLSLYFGEKLKKLFLVENVIFFLCVTELFSLFPDWQDLEEQFNNTELKYSG